MDYQYILDFFQQNLPRKIIVTIVIVLILSLIKFVIQKIIEKKISNLKNLYKITKINSYTIVAVGLILIGRMWFVGMQSIMTFLGLFSAGLAISLKDPLLNIVGWLFIFWRKPFEIGDRIQVGKLSGDVIDLSIFKFTVLEIGNWVHADQSTGRIIHIPNSRVFTDSISNYQGGFDFIWNEIPVLITFESDWKKTKGILYDIIQEFSKDIVKEAESQIKQAAKKMMIIYTHFTPIVYTSAEESGVLLTIRYLCDVKKRRGSTHEIWEKILDEFDKHDDIDLAYPTTRFYANNEGN